MTMAATPPLLATLDGYAVEGGFDTPGGIATCYSPAVALGRISGPGSAANLWEHYEIAVRHVNELGLDGIVLTVEWARVEPRPGQIDESAWERYRTVIATARACGLRVTVTVVDAVWPAWLGPESWLLPWTGPAFLLHVERLVERLGGDIDGLQLFSRGEALIDDGFLRGVIPPWRKREKLDAAEAKNHLRTLESTVRSRPAFSRLLIGSVAEIPAVLPASAWPAVVAQARKASEVHIRSLVRGAGPTAAASGLLTVVGGEARGQAPKALLDLWRS